jgi:hypothetical protein
LVWFADSVAANEVFEWRCGSALLRFFNQSVSEIKKRFEKALSIFRKVNNNDRQSSHKVPTQFKLKVFKIINSILSL